uniref:Uncharacterized protein n=1 Tax=Candidatus Kentrum sp. TC TaxID=2126339 RepID=A0A450ZDM3_9GAMM|nr:MAG: hypothetical protein BECKTC1821D_GA0114238_11444 [Candidatus Kentron sp. TC]VFK64473.1 MAG: hypothetical protein BECKTC1821F_GA0114240_11275 [Candidatus Kentron sp. TC]
MRKFTYRKNEKPGKPETHVGTHPCQSWREALTCFRWLRYRLSKEFQQQEYSTFSPEKIFLIDGLENPAHHPYL